MGSTAYAKLAWGIDLGNPENISEAFDWDEAGIDQWNFQDEVMPSLFGFTEEPPVRPDGLESAPLRDWFEVVRQPYNQRLEAAVPLKFEHYGYEFGGTALVLKRSLTTVDWGCDPVDPVTIAPPTPEEMAAFNTVMNRLEYDGGPPKLLLMALYG